MHLNKLSRRLLGRASQSETAIRVGAGIVVTLTTVVGAFLLYLAGDLKDPSGTSVKWLMLVLAGALGVVQIIANILATFLTRGDAEAASTILGIEEEVETAEYMIGYQYHHVTALASSLAALQALMGQERPKTQPELAARLDALLDPYWSTPEARSLLFGYEKQDVYSMTVYLWDEKDSLLKAYWRKGSDVIMQRGLGRHWEPGRGHVGQCYETGEIMVAADLKMAFHLDADDRHIYVSAASVPLFVGTNTVGVCILTSSL